MPGGTDGPRISDTTCKAITVFSTSSTVDSLSSPTASLYPFTSTSLAGIHPAFPAHNMQGGHAYLPSPRLYPAVLPGLVSPTIPSLTPTNGALGVSEAPVVGLAYERYNGVRVSSDCNGVATTGTNRTAASLAYVSRMQDGFPYGLSGVPSIPGYNYTNDLYNYVSNGFPRKSRICSYCTKVFTRSTTRRYHEKRCPLLRAAGSLIKGNALTASLRKSPLSSPNNLTKSSSEFNSPSREDSLDDSHTGITTEPPPLVSVSQASVPQQRPIPFSSTAHIAVDLAPETRCENSLFSSSKLPLVINDSLARPGSHVSWQFDSYFAAYDQSMPRALSSVIDYNNGNVDQNRNALLAVKPHVMLTRDSSPFNSRSTASNAQILSEVEADADKQRSSSETVFSPLSGISQSLGESPLNDDVGGNAIKTYEQSLVMSSSLINGVLKSEALRMNGVYMPCHKGNVTITKAFDVEHGNKKETFVPPLTNHRLSAEETFTVDKDSRVSSLDYNGHHTSVDIEGHQYNGGIKSHSDEETTTASFAKKRISMTRDYIIDDNVTACKKFCLLCKEKVEHTEDHRRMHQKYKPNSCRYCGQRFIKLSMRISHQRLHHAPEVFRCVVCSKCVISRFGMRQHVRREHRSLSCQLKCRFCSCNVQHVNELHDHFKSHWHLVDPSERASIGYLRIGSPRPSLFPFDVDETPPDFPHSADSKASPDSPIDMSTESRKHFAYTGVAPPDVVEHATLINGGRNFGSKEMEYCKLCEKDYPKSFMRYHERDHADQKPYSCPICNKRFGYKNNMKSHMKLHAGIKPYQCQVCMAKFTRGSTLRRHARRHGVRNNDLWDFYVEKNKVTQAMSVSNHIYGNSDVVVKVLNAGLDAHQNPRISSSLCAISPSDDVKIDSMIKFSQLSSLDLPVSGNLYNQNQSVIASAKESNVQPFRSTPSYSGHPRGYSATAAAVAVLPQTPLPPAIIYVGHHQPFQNDALDFSIPEKRGKMSAVISTDPLEKDSGTFCGFYQAAEPEPFDETPIFSSIKDEKNISFYHSKYSPSINVTRSDSAIGDDLDHRRSSLGIELAASNQNHALLSSRWCVSTSGDSMERYMNLPFQANFSLPSHQPGIHPHNYDIAQRNLTSVNDIATQASLCCFSRYSNNIGFGVDDSNSMPLDMSRKLDVDGRNKCPVTSRTTYQCKFCDCQFSRESYYRTHQQLHQGDCPFYCFSCQKDCRTFTGYTDHIVQHLGR